MSRNNISREREHEIEMICWAGEQLDASWLASFHLLSLKLRITQESEVGKQDSKKKEKKKNTLSSKKATKKTIN